MWSPRRTTLAGQFLALQLVVLVVALAVTSVVSVRQSGEDFADQVSARLRAAGQQVANLPVVRRTLDEPRPPASLASYAEDTQRTYLATSVQVVDASGRVVASSHPDDHGEVLDLTGSTVDEGRTWTGDVEEDGERAIAAQVPVIDNRSRQVGFVMVTENYPSLGTRLRDALPDLLSFLTLGLGLGVVGSWLLARLIKRRTRGLEPAEIAALADQREAVLHSIREGVVAVSADGQVTVVSDMARDLLTLPPDTVGRRLGDLPVEPRVRDLLVGDDDVRDAVVMVDGRVVVVNRNAVHHEGRRVGTVATLRDRTELLAMQSELNARDSVTSTLRAQTHEFANQLHTISGLLQLGEHDEAARLIGDLTRRRAAISESVTSRVDDPAVAALLIAKVSLAAERGVELALADDGSLPRLDPDVSADVGTVLGNLVDNAVDATVGAAGPRVDVRLALEGDAVVVQVADSGPGVPAESREQIFARGWTTKPTDASGRGVGLALVQAVAERRRGSVSVHNAVDGGAVFTVRLPRGGGVA